MLESRNIEIGKAGEDIAVAYLAHNNFSILERNWRYKNHHEIDIIAHSPINHLVAIEVRTHDEPQTYQPFESIDKQKIHRIKQALTMYAEQANYNHFPMRIDVISVVMANNHLEHFESVDVY